MTEEIRDTARILAGALMALRPAVRHADGGWRVLVELPHWYAGVKGEETLASVAFESREQAVEHIAAIMQEMMARVVELELLPGEECTHCYLVPWAIVRRASLPAEGPEWQRPAMGRVARRLLDAILEHRKHGRIEAAEQAEQAYADYCRGAGEKKALDIP